MPDTSSHILLPVDSNRAVLVGRVLRPKLGASVVSLRGGDVVDITANAPTMSHLLDSPDALTVARDCPGETFTSVDALLSASTEKAKPQRGILLAPCDLQPIKACGVTFAESMIERVIEERAGGDAERADGLRREIVSAIGMDLSTVRPGSPEASRLKSLFMAKGLWSQYLEVGIGPDAEVFSKAPPLAAVGMGAEVGIHPASRWNNPEPEVVLAIDGTGRARGATLGNDVNLRDIEGRSALLLGKAKDNNASCAIGPFLRLFDGDFGMDDVRNAELTLTVTGTDGFILRGQSSMSKISRAPEDLIAQAWGPHHQYPDGFMLFLGTLFAPTQDRDETGGGFTHHSGDVVEIHSPRLGTLINTVADCTLAPPWTYGLKRLMSDLAARDLPFSANTSRTPGKPRPSLGE